jgi:hypothetical protein
MVNSTVVLKRIGPLGAVTGLGGDNFHRKVGCPGLLGTIFVDAHEASPPCACSDTVVSFEAVDG